MTAPSPIRDVARLVHAEILRTVEQRPGTPGALAGHELLTSGLGLTSLQVAGIAARLAEAVGADPFSSMALTEIRTVGDLCRALEAAAAGTGTGPELRSARLRAEARQRRLAR